MPKDKKKEKDKRKTEKDKTREKQKKPRDEGEHGSAKLQTPKLHLPPTPRSQAVKKGQQTPLKSQRAKDNGDPRTPRTQYTKGTKTTKDTKRTVSNTHKQDGTIRDQDASITK